MSVRESEAMMIFSPRPFFVAWTKETNSFVLQKHVSFSLSVDHFSFRQLNSDSRIVKMHTDLRAKPIQVRTHSVSRALFHHQVSPPDLLQYSEIRQTWTYENIENHRAKRKSIPSEWQSKTTAEAKSNRSVVFFSRHSISNTSGAKEQRAKSTIGSLDQRSLI